MFAKFDENDHPIICPDCGSKDFSMLLFGDFSQDYSSETGEFEEIMAENIREYAWICKGCDMPLQNEIEKEAGEKE